MCLSSSDRGSELVERESEGGARERGIGKRTDYLSVSRDDNSLATRYLRVQKNNEIDAKFGFERYQLSVEKMGWLLNMHSVSARLLLTNTHTLHTHTHTHTQTHTHTHTHT